MQDNILHQKTSFATDNVTISQYVSSQPLQCMLRKRTTTKKYQSIYAIIELLQKLSYYLTRVEYNWYLHMTDTADVILTSLLMQIKSLYVQYHCSIKLTHSRISISLIVVPQLWSISLAKRGHKQLMFGLITTQSVRKSPSGQFDERSIEFFSLEFNR